MHSQIFVRNLSPSATASGLREVFSRQGPVNRVKLILDHATGRSRGFAFVTMMTREDAAAAIQMLDGKRFLGSLLHVSQARARA